MRLIDADALTMNASTGCTDYVADELAEWVWEAPTVDAIPMDWMDAQIRGYASTLKSTELKALIIVKGLWEKDQEGKS
jgi:phage gp29-like protein